MLIVNVLLTLLFGTTSFYLIGTNVLTWVGVWKIFKKCGAKPWHAVIPYYREYVMAECAGREAEGRIVFVSTIISSLCSVINIFLSSKNIVWVFVDITQIVTGLVVLIYEIRIYAGLTDVFGRSKLWILPWIFLDWIVAPIWGFRDKYQPKWKLEDFAGAEAEFFSGAHAAALDKGLAVNIDERSVRDFFKSSIFSGISTCTSNRAAWFSFWAAPAPERRRF